MPLPSLAEDVLTLVSRPDLTPTERTLLKLAATLIVQARMEEDEFDQLNDPRIEMDREEYRTLPDRFELIAGKVRPKEWDSPERLAAAARNEQRIQAEMAKGLSYLEACKVVYGWRDVTLTLVANSIPLFFKPWQAGGR